MVTRTIVHGQMKLKDLFRSVAFFAVKFAVERCESLFMLETMDGPTSGHSGAETEECEEREESIVGVGDSGPDWKSQGCASSKEKFSTTSLIATKQAATIPRHESPKKRKTQKFEF